MYVTVSSTNVLTVTTLPTPVGEMPIQIPGEVTVFLGIVTNPSFPLKLLLLSLSGSFCPENLDPSLPPTSQKPWKPVLVPGRGFPLPDR